MLFTRKEVHVLESLQSQDKIINGSRMARPRPSLIAIMNGMGLGHLARSYRNKSWVYKFHNNLLSILNITSILQFDRRAKTLPNVACTLVRNGLKLFI